MWPWQTGANIKNRAKISEVSLPSLPSSLRRAKDALGLLAEEEFCLLTFEAVLRRHSSILKLLKSMFCRICGIASHMYWNGREC